jgi:hypothetical protein
MTTGELEFGLSLEQLMVLGLVALMGVVVLFILLGVVRIWGLRMQKSGGGRGGLDLDHLKRQRDAGQISPAEYDAIRARLAGGAKPSGPRPGRSIDEKGGPPSGPQGSESNG